MIKWAVTGICVALAVLGITLAASFCFIVAFFLWVAPHLGAALAAAITGVALLLLAGLLALAAGLAMRLLKRRPPSLMNEVQKAVVLAAKLMLLRDPKKALLVSLVAGALSEFFLAPGRKR